MNKGALGLAYVAKKLVLGADEVVIALRKKEVFLVLLANDASENTKKRISDKTQTYQVELMDRYTTEELSSAVGKKNIKVIGIKDKGFSMLLK
ncbi:Ribosomal protein L30E [Acholeplasma oculi]|uniref:Ribosomal protein L7Ae/L30e/S12e/Gadd45 n=1 Tax=Acholeplasma oculi TaxID=35623 RepID=A0A061ABF4_9MOLU|nr:ribosomal L7Ae/L30e/S12e/Gadd45 family protein [Acholeplasma oculi]CDR31190.1 Ribosomal protein L7Ae/L30e/S12e/Gadd45 [Acholeplasma oculi]SKC37843.1 Ribosomal protein L7Ae [Acholeplasma oculi]SUT91104.1 Ribosomal protein L30E [Acholeplasma oculi]